MRELARLERMPEGAAGIFDDAQLPRLADRHAVVEERSRGGGHRAGARDPRRGSLRAREGQAAHPRVSRGAQAESAGTQPDPVLRRAAGRGQDLAGPEHRQGARPAVPPREPGRRARRGGDPRPPAHLHRLAAGNIAQALRKAGRNNPVLMLDEVDKLSASYQGDPFSALLEVLDPEQNNTFRDNYLGVPLDLSKVLFIGTANVLDAIPAPLRDRMEVIELSGYTEEEKLQIARRHLLARQLKANGLSGSGARYRGSVAASHRRLHPRGGRPQSRTADRSAAAACRRDHRLRAGRLGRHRGGRRACDTRGRALRERGGA